MPWVSPFRKLMWSLFGLALALACGSCCPSRPAVSHIRSPAAQTSAGEDAGEVLHGDASYYASFFKGRRTSNGERYDPNKLTAANRSLPFGTRLRVTRLDTGRSVVVRVNDRGPFGKRRRILDLSHAAAEELGMIGQGHAEVEAVVLQ